MIILYDINENKKALLPWQTKELSFMVVDSKGLEPLTFRTSSGSSTS